jgi:phosphate/sulfate permease
MHVEILLLGLAILAGGYLAVNIGANDVANAMGTSVGSKALRQLVYLLSITQIPSHASSGG